MKKLITTSVFFVAAFAAVSCPVCERNKPKVLRGITHGTNADSSWDYVIVIATAIIAVLTLFYSIKWLVRPNENAHNHIKNIILNK
jgi:formate hydrogenlyase subunit 3/multisubunit Na+/H+ antiporter MnhD subunit